MKPVASEARRIAAAAPESVMSSPAPPTKAITYQCAGCLDLGWYLLDVDPAHPEWGKPQRCECQRQSDLLNTAERTRRRLIRIDGLLDEERKLRLSDLAIAGDFGIAHSTVIACLSRHAGFITLAGGTGTGKTVLLMGAVNQAREAGISAAYRRVSKFFQELRACYDSQDSDGFTDRWHTVTHARVFALDEIDKWSPTPWAQERFDELIDDRYRARSQYMTLLAGNTLDQIGAANESRIRDAQAHQFTLQGIDLRKEQR